CRLACDFPNITLTSQAKSAKAVQARPQPTPLTPTGVYPTRRTLIHSPNPRNCLDMAIATLSKVEKHFGKQVLFENLDLSIYEGERVGFIGANGAGKSTLFKMLTGQVQPDAGLVAVG